MSRLLKITDNGNGILVQGTDNILYPDNATLTFPYNSIILVTDESNIATFRSASNNDVLFSGLIGNIEIGSATVTKANIIEKFDEIANQASGGGGGEFDPTQYYTKSQTNALLDEKADESDIPTDISELNNDAGYITQDEVIINESFPISWLSAQSMSELITAINNDSDAVVGKVYMDTISLSDLPAGMLQAEVKAEIMSELSGEKVILFTVTSSNTSPYHWEYTSAYGATGSWREWVTPQQLATVATSGSYNDLSNKPTIPTVPTNVSAFVNDVPYLTQHQDISAYFNGAEYDSNTKRINFKNGNNVIAYIDATAFIKDGMVDTVAISNGNLVITFNTDAGKQPISIPLTDIFNPSNYYDKTATDTLLSAKANSADLATVATSGDYDDLSNKPTIPTVPTNVSAFTNDAGYLTEHQSLAEYYTKTQSDAKYLDKATFDTKEETISTALNDLETNKQDTLIAGTNISIQGNVISASGSASQIQSDWNQTDSNSVDYIKNKPTIPAAQVQSDWSQTDTSAVDYIKNKPNLSTVATSGSYNDLSNKPTIPTVPTNVSAFTNDAGYLDSSDLAGYATQSDLADYQPLLTAGTNITIDSNNVISATGGGSVTQVQSDWNQTDTTAVDYIKNKPTIPDVSDYVEKTVFNAKELAIANALTQLNNDKADKTELPDVSSYVTASSLATVATSGSYKDLSNKPTIPAAQVQSDWNQTDTTAADYIKNKPTIPDTSAFMTTAAFDIKEEVISTALNELDARIGDINTLLEAI